MSMTTATAMPVTPMTRQDGGDNDNIEVDSNGVNDNGDDNVNGEVAIRGCTGEFSRVKAEKKFGSTYARKIEAEKLSQRTIHATPKIGDFYFQQWWPIPIST
jgi:hypothetical protein